MKQELKGCGVAMVTPFSENGRVDYAGLERLIKHLHKGADYLVVMGTTGEAVTLDFEEQATILDFVIEINANKLPIVFGIGGNNTKAVAERMAAFDPKKATAFLSVSPFYNKPSQEGIYRHFRALSDASPLP
ncbi:MAG: dihydrodipicolinate synthase family protein, partial [Flavobacteriales bacterium]|nr:dihydrodipicolinate synthase family protein [Flavobacteriales bacterium]